MAQAALRIADDEIDTSIVRRLMARPLHVVPAPVPVSEEPAPVPARPDQTNAEVSRLRAEIQVMKAVLGAERRETERLRDCLTRMEVPETLTPEARIVRDRWAALVDMILDGPR
jgi:hypothetical protein